jgi:hypothetical protein
MSTQTLAPILFETTLSANIAPRSLLQSELGIRNELIDAMLRVPAIASNWRSLGAAGL